MFFNELSEKELREKLEAFERMLQRSNDAAKREGLEKQMLHVRRELEFKIASREQRATNRRPKAPAKAPKKTSKPVVVAAPKAPEAPEAPAGPHARQQKVADDARAAADTLLQKLSDALRKAEESRRHEDAVRRDITATLQDKKVAVDRTLLDEEIAQDIQMKADTAVAKANKKEAAVRKAEAGAAAYWSSLSVADQRPAFQPLTDSQLLPADPFETGEQIPAFPGETPAVLPQLAPQRPLADRQSVQDGNGQTVEARSARLAKDRETEAEAEVEIARLAEEAKQAQAEAQAEDARLKAFQLAKQEWKDAQVAQWHQQLESCHSVEPQLKPLACDDGTTPLQKIVSDEVIDSASFNLAIAALAFAEELEGQFSLTTDALQLMSRVTDQHGITCLLKPDTLIIPLLLNKDESIMPAVPAQEFENDVGGYINPSAQDGFLASAGEQQRQAYNVRSTNQSARDHIQRPQRPTEVQERQGQEQWNQGRIGHYIVVIAERTPGSAKVKLSYMNSMQSYCTAYGEVNEVRGLARTIVCNSGWMAGQKPQWMDEDWTPVALQGGGNTCGYHAVLDTWAYMLGIKINVSARCTQSDYKSARHLINLALQGGVSSLEIEVRMLVHGYARSRPSPPSSPNAGATSNDTLP